jgi:hypothetical protein
VQIIYSTVCYIFYSKHNALVSFYWLVWIVWFD